MGVESLPVPPELRGAVEQAWVLDMPAAHVSEQVLPMPMTEIIVNLSDPYLLAEDRLGSDDLGRAKTDRATPPVFCTGLRPRVVRFGNPTRIRHVAMRLPCYGLARFGTLPPHGVGPVGGRLGLALDDQARSGADPRAVGRRVLEILVEHVRDETEEQECVREAVEALQSDPTRAIGGIAQDAGITHKALIARFRRVTGITPSRFAQLVMVDAVVRAVPTAGPVPTWTDLVADSPYVDQSHFIRSFRRLVGMSPREYRDALARSRYADPRFVAADAGGRTEVAGPR